MHFGVGFGVLLGAGVIVGAGFGLTLAKSADQYVP